MIILTICILLLLCNIALLVANIEEYGELHKRVAMLECMVNSVTDRSGKE